MLEEEEDEEASITKLAKLYSSMCRRKRQLREVVEEMESGTTPTVAQRQKLSCLLNNFQESMQQLEELFLCAEKDLPSFSKDLWRRRINTFRHDLDSIHQLLENQPYLLHEKLERESELRQRLLEKPTAETTRSPFHSDPAISMYKEREELLHADYILSTLLQQGAGVMSSLDSQNKLIKKARRTFFAFRTSLHTSESFIKMVFRRNAMDSLIIKILMILTLVFLAFLYYLLYIHSPAQ